MMPSALRRARTAALWLAGPIDRAWRRITRQPVLPPLWLRRHTGPVARFESAAREMAELLDGLSLLSEGPIIVDAGCGIGAMVPWALSRLGTAGRYVGFDVHGPSIRWCRGRWNEDRRLEFHVADVPSAYGANIRSAVETYRFPLGNAAADFVLAKSLYTHLLEREARHYLAETQRTLRPGAAAVVTAFLFDGAGRAGPDVRRAFPQSDEDGGVRWRSRSRPSSAVAYEKTRFTEMVETAGLHVQWHRAGYYPGSSHLGGQDVLLIGH